jgi:uncharacterized repeat protein (TIGR03806 family)
LAVLAATAHAAPPEAVCEWTDTRIVIDGKGDDAAWQRATVIDRFVMPWANDKKPAHATRAKLLWDREHFYFLAEMDDPHLTTRPTEHNGRVWEQDCFEIFLKPAPDKPGYYEFEVSPANATLELFIPSRDKGGYNEFKDKHPFKFETAVTLRGELNQPKPGGGWIVEGRIRWADLAKTGGRPAVNEVWQYALCRVDFHDLMKPPELSTTAPLTKPGFHRHEEYGRLRFAPPPAEKAGIDQRPKWERSKLVGFPDPPPPYKVEKAFPKLSIKQPVYVIEEPSTDDFWVVQHLGHWAGPGRILRVKNSSDADNAETILDSDNLIYALCFHPKFAENGYVYLHSNGPTKSAKKFNHITRYTVDPKTRLPDLATKLEIVEPFESNGHNGGGIEFGPDGMLYFTTGDTTSDSDTGDRGQDLRHLSSAVVRIDVDHPDPGKNYGVPKDNPFVGMNDVRPEIWAHGLRNPWRMGFDHKTGTLWVGNNGQDVWEQIYAVRKGANYGWPVYEGSRKFHAHRKLAPTPLGAPAIEHHHAEARSLTGGVVYHGTKFPDLTGAYVYGDFSTGRIWAAKYDGQKVSWHKEIAKTTIQIVNFYADRHGDLFVCDDAGGVHKLVSAPATQPVASNFPRLLSQTGLFVDTAKHQVDPGLIPYDVISPLYSDNADKLRYIALPGDATIDHTPTRGWNFPNGAATVKTFTIDTEPGNPASRRRLETRVLLKQLGNWTGYTYVWNAAQTDAELAPAEGLDQKLTIKDSAAPGGVREQTWHYPSRAECLVCHSRAFNFSLGLSDLQMNRDFDYGHGRVANQLRTLEHLGVLRTDQGAKSADTTGQRAAPKSTLLPRSPEHFTRLANPADASETLDRRARSYLHANCAHCHVEAGGGNASVDLEFTTDPARTRMFNAPPQANPLNHPEAKLIAPGRPDLSVLHHRAATRGPGQMPPVGTSVPDTAGTALLKEWIQRMPASTQPVR